MTARTRDSDVGLDDRGVAENAVHRRHEHLAESVRLDVLSQQHEQITDQSLVRQARRGGHEQLAFVQLVAPAVGRKRFVVAVGENDTRWHFFHLGDESITQPVVADRATTRNVQCFRRRSKLAYRIADAERSRTPCGIAFDSRRSRTRDGLTHGDPSLGNPRWVLRA